MKKIKDEQVPAVCENEDCEAYRSFELVDVDDIRDDDQGREFVECFYCKEPVYLEKFDFGSDDLSTDE